MHLSTSFNKINYSPNTNTEIRQGQSLHSSYSIMLFKVSLVRVRVHIQNLEQNSIEHLITDNY